MSQIVQTVFLDTSMQMERILAIPETIIGIENQLGSPNVQAVTSLYVWMEFQRTIVDDHAHIHRIMYKHYGWADTITHLLDGARAFRPRAAVRCSKIIGSLFRQSYEDWPFAQELLAAQIEGGLERRFWHNVTPLNDPLTCNLVTQGINHLANDTYMVASTCRKEHATCHLPDFLRQQRPQLQVVAEYLAGTPNAIKGQKRVVQLLAKIMEEPRSALGQASCWPLGDLIIALQVPADAMIWTLDSDFAALASALGLRHANPLAASDTG